MKIAEFLQVKAVVPELSSRTKQEVLQELSDAMAVANPTLNRDRLVHALRER